MRSLPFASVAATAALAVASALSSSCAVYGYSGGYPGGYAGYGCPARCACVRPGLFALLATALDRASVDDREAVERAEEAPVYAPTIPHAPPRVTALDPVRVGFDSGAALAAIHAVDLSPCVDRGAPRGYGHARVTFGEDGRVTQVTLDAPPGMAKDAVGCVGDRLGRAQTQPFDGAPIAVGASYLIK